MVYPIGKIAGPLFAIPVRKVKGIEHLPRDVPCIIASNHTSFVDPLFIAIKLSKFLKKKVMYFISAMYLFNDLVAHLFFSEFGRTIRLKKKIHGGFMKSALNKLKQGHAVCIFPEGIPNRSAELREGKTGVARLALQAKVPVIPISMQGTLNFWSREKWIPRLLKRVTIIVGKPIDLSEWYGKDDDYEALKEVTSVIMTEIGKLTDREYKF